jgi:hypothetical protein
MVKFLKQYFKHRNYFVYQVVKKEKGDRYMIHLSVRTDLMEYNGDKLGLPKDTFSSKGIKKILNSVFNIGIENLTCNISFSFKTKNK